MSAPSQLIRGNLAVRRLYQSKAAYGACFIVHLFVVCSLQAICRADYIHIAAGRSGERAEHTAASTASPFSPTFASPTAAAVAASSSACKPCSTSSSAHSASSGFSMDAEYLRRADEEYVLGLFGARLPSEDSVQQKRQQLSVDQQTASQFAGTESRHSAAIDAAALHATPSPPPPQQQQQRKNKAEAKAEARKDRDQVSN